MPPFPSLPYLPNPLQLDPSLLCMYLYCLGHSCGAEMCPRRIPRSRCVRTSRLSNPPVLAPHPTTARPHARVYKYKYTPTHARASLSFCFFLYETAGTRPDSSSLPLFRYPPSLSPGWSSHGRSIWAVLPYVRTAEPRVFSLLDITRDEGRSFLRGARGVGGALTYVPPARALSLPVDWNERRRGGGGRAVLLG